MGKSIRTLLQAAIAVAFGMLLYLPVSATQSEIDDVSKNIEKLEEEQEESRQELKGLKENKALLDGRLSDLNEELSELAVELGSIQEQLTGKQEDILQTRQQLDEARADEVSQYENMKKRIRFFYEKGSGSLLAALLEAGSFGDFLNRVEYVQLIHQYDREMLEEFRRVTEEIDAREAQLDREQQELTALAEQQQEKIAQIQVLVAEVEADLDSAGRKIHETQLQLAAYEIRIQEQRDYEQQLEKEKAAEEDRIRKEQEAAKEDEKRQEEQEQLPPPVVSDSQSDIAMLAALIECEAGNQSYEGKLAVGSVVMNRVRSTLFPNTLLEVIYQSGQFTPVASGRFATVLSRGASESCVQAATEVLSGTITLDKLFFRRNNGSKDGIVIGDIVFY